MSQRESGYERKERDLYETPEWVTTALAPHLPALGKVWEPACGNGKMVAALQSMGADVWATDIETGVDFLRCGGQPDWDAIITNPPYALAQEFIEHAIRITVPSGFVAMLLRTDFDHAKTRQHLFSQHPAFAKKVVLTKRIKWFEESKGQPSFNHAWFIWDWQHKGPPTLAYGPTHQ
jgi:methylase of polypeptide subunit release factors